MKLAGLSILLLAPALVPAQEPASNASKPADHPGKVSVIGTEPESHSGLAEYFRDLASQEQALAESYERIAALYQKSPPSGLDPATARQMKIQYRRLTEVETKAAKAAGELAEYHSRLAEELSHATVGPPQLNPGEAAFRK